jgi:hypothetical protein
MASSLPPLREMQCHFVRHLLRESYVRCRLDEGHTGQHEPDHMETIWWEPGIGNLWVCSCAKAQGKADSHAGAVLQFVAHVEEATS